MSLTVGRGPFAKEPAGRFNTEIHSPTGAVLFFDPVPQRIRALFGGETVVDSRNAKLLHETGHLPVYYFPVDDVRQDLLERTEKRTHCPHKGEASYWALRAGSRIEVDVTSSNFPRRARNTNSGNALLASDTEADIRVATNVVPAPPRGDHTPMT